ncbi:MAG: DNA/RNA nuclease SfsA [Candidatus Hodarchaeota archaeon]
MGAVNSLKCEGSYKIAIFLERPNRFLAKVNLAAEGAEERIVEVHVPDPGRLKEILLPNTEVVLRESTNLTRKTRYSLVGVKTGNVWVNIDSHISNRLFKKEFRILPQFSNYNIKQSEYSFGNSRFDFLMSDRKSKHHALVEVKSVTLVQNRQALFPDAPTKRGTKHLIDLSKAIEKQFKAFIVFIVKRNDVDSLSPNKKMDPTFTSALSKSIKSGVQVCTVKCIYDPIIKRELKIVEEIPFIA